MPSNWWSAINLPELNWSCLLTEPLSWSLSLYIYFHSVSLSLNLSISPSFSLSPTLSLSLWLSVFASETWMNTSSSGIAQDGTLPNLILLSLCLYLSSVLCVLLSLCQSIKERAKSLLKCKIKLLFYYSVDPTSFSNM